MYHPSPADELANIRTEIARLRARESALRKGFVKEPYAFSTGQWNRIEVTERCHHVFDPDLLPPEIRNDRRYMRAKLVQIVRCLPMDPRPAHRPGWPIKREQASAVH